MKTVIVTKDFDSHNPLINHHLLYTNKKLPSMINYISAARNRIRIFVYKKLMIL